MGNQNIEPKFLEEVFNCPHCKSKTKQEWYIAHGEVEKKGPYLAKSIDFYRSRIQDKEHVAWQAQEVIPEEQKYLVFSPTEWHIDMSVCTICSEYLLWKDEHVIYPNCHFIEDPGADMPEEVKNLYNEARAVVNLSPKSACALLRLAVEKLLIVGLECPPRNSVNDNIKFLKRDGKLSQPIEKALNAVRLVGNAAVHAGKIDLDDKPEYAYTLFGLLNYIVDDLISRPARAEAFLKTIKS
ncbi:DUF4145 domain-containing protein [Bacillus thuringiensis]|uniref:DUF4145 domain-containing protein n=1 Tax=Bacillus thuringiensis TaxID=1428 RepID=UPI00273C7017|nr:DUF4145 domain-containing protein [Bacillus thuringiensis]WLP66610.1 DUF4145 domain-containing protein [Bacillus thuringiensis]